MSNIRISGDTPFLSQGHPVGHVKDFWGWALSDLQMNTARAFLAEYIVALALGVTEGVYTDWKDYDLDFGNIKVEVKSSAYIQSWDQQELSKPRFNISPTQKEGDSNGVGTDSEKKRRCDVYVFCLHSCKDRECVEALDLDQWDFYIVPTRVFNETMLQQKTLALGKLEKLTAAVKFQDLKDAIVNACSR